MERPPAPGTGFNLKEFTARATAALLPKSTKAKGPFSIFALFATSSVGAVAPNREAGVSSRKGRNISASASSVMLLSMFPTQTAVLCMSSAWTSFGGEAGATEEFGEETPINRSEEPHGESHDEQRWQRPPQQQQRF